MKVIVNILRIVVGILFFISGFIKLNDPVGFSYKLQEYFSPGVLDLDFLSPYALGIAIILVIIELLLGIGLIIGYYKKATLGLLLAMILFFTFLTFYSAYYNKVTDCGCFGDALPLTPWQSFSKDVVLLVMILILIAGQRYLQPFFSRFGRTIVIFASFVGALGFGYYVLMHLPVFDFRAYKVGANIQEGMEVPDGAQQAIFEYRWKFNVDGQEKIITTPGDYPNSSGEFMGVETEMIQAGYVPPIHDFTIDKAGEDYTQQFLDVENLLVIVAYDITKTEWNGWPKVKKLTDDALKKGYTVIGLSASGENKTEDLILKQKLNFEFYSADATTLKTIIRSNPGILKLQKGTVLQKKHWNDVNEINLQTLPTAKPNLDLSLKFKLDTIARLDEKYWELAQLEKGKRSVAAKQIGLEPEDYENDWITRLNMLNISSLDLVTSYLNKQIYPGKDTVGEPTNLIALNVIKHNPEQIPQYLDILKKAGREGQLPFTLIAALEDRYLVGQGKPQLYGTQAWVTKNHGVYIWPITQADTVNNRRKKAGFTRTIADYAKELIDPEYEYTNMTVAEIEKL
ncbi:MAG TPA: DoxX family membrane protein [Leeuwenhoekiella sp.]|nr:DoxX family membrane protein [Leeuwenhoekiella sp.]